jgi:hypothetical protein
MGSPDLQEHLQMLCIPHQAIRLSHIYRYTLMACSVAGQTLKVRPVRIYVELDVEYGSTANKGTIG